jgi:putative FmdB family regulatory protein
MPIYEYQCVKCGRVDEEYASLPHIRMESTCSVCGARTERIYSVSSVRIFQSFVTRNIIEDGTPVRVTSQSQLHQLETDHGVKLADAGSAPKTSFPEPI